MGKKSKNKPNSDMNTDNTDSEAVFAIKDKKKKRKVDWQKNYDKSAGENSYNVEETIVKVKKTKHTVITEKSAEDETLNGGDAKKKKKKFSVSEEDQIDDKNIDEFCNDLDEEANKQYEGWIKLLETNVFSKKKSAKNGVLEPPVDVKKKTKSTWTGIMERTVSVESDMTPGQTKKERKKGDTLLEHATNIGEDSINKIKKKKNKHLGTGISTVKIETTKSSKVYIVVKL